MDRLEKRKKELLGRFQAEIAFETKRNSFGLLRKKLRNKQLMTKRDLVSSIAKDEQMQRDLEKELLLGELYSGLESSNDLKVLDTITRITKILLHFHQLEHIFGSETELFQKNKRGSIITRLVALLEAPNPSIPQAVCNCFGHFAQHPVAASLLIANPRVGPLLKKLLLSPNDSICESAAQVIESISMPHSQVQRSLIEQQDFMPTLLTLLSSSNITLVYSAALAIGALSFEYAPKHDKYASLLISKLSKVLMTHSNPSILAKTIRALAYLVTKTEDDLEDDYSIAIYEKNLDLVVQTGIIPRLIELLSHSNHEIRDHAVTIVAYLSYGSHYSLILDPETLRSIARQLASGGWVGNEAMWAICNIMNKEPSIAIESGAIQILLQVSNFASFGVHTLCILQLLVTKATWEQIRKLVKDGIFKPFCACLSPELEPSKIQEMIVYCLRKYVEKIPKEEREESIQELREQVNLMTKLAALAKLTLPWYQEVATSAAEILFSLGFSTEKTNE